MTDKLNLGAATPVDRQLPTQLATPMQTSFLKNLTATACLGVALLGFNQLATAQLSVGPTGLAAQTFGTLPLVTEWSTLNVLPSASGNITTGAGLDSAVQTNTAASIIAGLATDASTPVPAASGSAQWNSSGFYLQTRPTGNSYTLLMATLRNNTGSNIISATINYDLSALVAAGSGIVEEVPGHRAFYSLTGTTGTWVRIPEFDSSSPSNAGPKTATISLGAWATNSNLFLLWADDNGSASGTPPLAEGSYTIDNFAVKAIPGSAPMSPPVITTQPQSLSVAPGNPATFTVVASGTSPLVYQWRFNSNNIAGATNSTYTIPSAVGTNQGFYMVVITNGLGSATSTNANLSVVCSTPASIVTQPVGQSLTSGSALSLTVGASGTSPFLYQWYRNNALVANATNATYTKANAQAGDSGVYFVVVNNCSGTPVTSANVFVSVSDAPYTLFGLTNKLWRYEQSNTDLGTAWQAVGFDDSLWPQGRGILAFETDAPGIVTPAPGLTNTVLLLTNNAGVNIPTHYFRTHFTLTNDPSLVSLSTSNYIDDGAVVYVNGVEAFRVNMSAGNVLFSTLAPAAGPAPEGTFVVRDIPSALLVPGDNVIAVEVHQVSLTSSDIDFGMELKVTYLPPTLLVITNQPESLTVFEAKPATFLLGLQGQPAYYQWYFNGTAISNGTSNPLNIPIVSTNDAGTYFVVATNSINSVTSSVVYLSVLADTNGPVLIEADGTANLTNVLVSFSELISLTTATNVANYKITNTVTGASLTISKAVLQNGSNVLLTTTARASGTNYILIVNNLRDVSPRANLIAANSSIPVSSLVSVLALDGSWRAYDPYSDFPIEDPADLGTAWKEFSYVEGSASTNSSSGGFNHDVWGTGQAVFWLAQDEGTIPGPAHTQLGETTPVITYFRTGFNAQFSSGGLKLLLTHIFGDGAVVYLNGKEIYRFNMPSGPVDYRTTSLTAVNPLTRIGPITIPASGLRSGSNVLAVELHQFVNVSTTKAMGVQLDAAVQSFNVGPVVITGCPQDLTVGEGSNATFTVVQAGGTIFQWQQNNVNIPGATNSSYTISPVTTNLDGAMFRVSVSNSTSGAFSCNATLRVRGDTNAPTIVSAFAGTNNTITVTFSEALAQATATNKLNYTMTNSAGSAITVTGAVLNNGTNVVLSFATQLGGRYTVVVNNLTDASSRTNAIAPNSAVTVGADYTVAFSSAWKYLLINTNDTIQSTFTGVAYDDSAWSGPSNALLYVETAALPGPKNTPLSLVDGSGNVINTFYFRQKFVTAITSPSLTFHVRHIIDDGLVLHLNGVEIYRYNMPVGAVTAATQAAANIGDATLLGPFDIVVTNLVGGTNVLAAEVHQQGNPSSDVTFGVELTASIPSVPITPPNAVKIVSPPSSQSVGTNAVVSFTVVASGDPTLYYQWRKNGANIPTANSSVYSIPGVPCSAAGAYTVVVTNSFSSVTSIVANLIITNCTVACTITTPAAPVLTVRQVGTNYVLTWNSAPVVTNSCGATGVFTLQRTYFFSNAPLNALWSNITTVSPYTSGIPTNKVPVAGGAGYFRLKIN